MLCAIYVVVDAPHRGPTHFWIISSAGEIGLCCVQNVHHSRRWHTRAHPPHVKAAIICPLIKNASSRLKDETPGGATLHTRIPPLIFDGTPDLTDGERAAHKRASRVDIACGPRHETRGRDGHAFGAVLAAASTTRAFVS